MWNQNIYQTKQELGLLRKAVEEQAAELRCGLFEVMSVDGTPAMQQIVVAETNLILAESIDRLASMFPRGF